MIEKLRELRVRRLVLQRQADALEQEEKDLTYELTKGFTFDQAKYNVTEGGYILRAERKTTVNVTDWTQLLTHIKQTGQVDLLQKRVTESAVKQRWDNGLSVPGAEQAHKWAVTVTKEQ